MKFRSVEIFTGAVFQVPANIQRIDTSSTHGWQLRYGRGKTEMFSDFTPDGSGAQAALDLAVQALKQRIEKLPAPSGLKVSPLARKANELPVGISGPSEQIKKRGGTSYYCFQVSVPLPGGGSTTKKIYIGTARTYSLEREAIALEKAVAVRAEAEKLYKSAKTKEVRAKATNALSGAVGK